jgi:hypothetical protein
MNAGAWKRELAAYRKEFINSKGWSEKQVASWIRDAWAYFDNGELAIPLETRSDALPVFQFRTPAGWKFPLLLRLHVLEQFRLQGRLQGDSSVKSLTPREEVFALIREQGSTITGQSGQSELKRELAEREARNLSWFLDSEEFDRAGDPVWYAISAAYQFGRLQLLAEIYADEEVLEENMLGPLMNRKGKTAKGRKQPKVSPNIFRKRVQNLVCEGLKAGLNASGIRAFVERNLFTKGMKCEGENYIFRGVTAQKETVRKWVRDELKRQVRN